MIEILFGESEAGGMKCAKNYRAPLADENPAVAWFGKKPTKEEIEEMFAGESVGGNAGEVVALPFMMDIGNIKETVDSHYRKKLIGDFYTQSGWEDNPKVLEELYHTADRYVNELRRLESYAAAGEALRIWYSNAPYSICGFYHVCYLLRKYDCSISVVKMPEYQIPSNKEMQIFSNWGEIDAGKFYTFLSLERSLSAQEIQYFSTQWIALMEDNSPLRAVINGKVVSVSEDFYDFLLKREMPEESIKEARLIGEILGKYSLGISDYWYAFRIEKMIEAGEIKVLEDSMHKYTRLLKKG